jgi:hypothetical protein
VAAGFRVGPRELSRFTQQLASEATTLIDVTVHQQRSNRELAGASHRAPTLAAIG